MLNKIKNIYRRKFWSDKKYARYIGVKFGKNCSIMTKNFGSEPYLIKIGNHVQITSGVTFANHGAAWVYRENNPKIDFFGRIEIGNNVYIGTNSIILPGISIGNNVIIGAGSVITKSVPNNYIVGGNPAKRIGTVDEFENKIRAFDMKSKGLSYGEKRKLLLKSSDKMFFSKPTID